MNSIIFAVAMAIYTLLIGIIGFLAKDKIKGQEDRIKALECKVESIQTNYLNRFEGIKQHVTEKFDELKDIVNEIKINIAEIK